MSKIRAHGLDMLRDVKTAYMEADGEVTVIPRKPGQDSAADNGGSKQH